MKDAHSNLNQLLYQKGRKRCANLVMRKRTPLYLIGFSLAMVGLVITLHS
jgi:hypothetical protein